MCGGCVGGECRVWTMFGKSKECMSKTLVVGGFRRWCVKGVSCVCMCRRNCCCVRCVNYI